MIVVIGAGAAGIAAARSLHDAGRQVVVLEARDRIGGRVWTIDAQGTAIDLGASWIHGVEGNPIKALADELGIDTAHTAHHHRRIFDVRDGELSPEQALAQLTSFRNTLRMASELAAAEHGDLPLEQALDRVAGDLSNGRDRRAHLWGKTWLGLVMGADAADLSARYWSQDTDLPGADHLFPGGYGELLDRMADGLSVRLSCPARAIQWGGPQSIVRTDHDAIACEAVVVTLPLGVLAAKDVVFDPPLPARKAEAVERLGFGLLDKVVLRFAERFWQGKAAHLGLMSEQPTGVGGFLDMSRYPGQAPTLIGFTAGRAARALAELDDEGAVASAMTTLREMLPQAPDPVASFVTRWSKDPWSRGSYSHIPVGATGAEYDVLASPLDGRVFFAGEATHREHPATVHGAYLSGRRAAAEILEGSASNA